MKRTQTILSKAILILIGGVIMVALFWLAYYGVTVLLRSTLYLDNPQNLRQGTLRNILALLACFLTLALLRTKLHENVKGMFLLSGTAVFVIALVLHFYMIMWLASILVVSLSGIIIWILIKRHKSWIYFYALGIGILVGLLYAWPR